MNIQAPRRPLSVPAGPPPAEPHRAGRAELLLAQWSRGVAEILAAMKTADFEAAVLQAVKRLVDFDFVMSFGYAGPGRPSALGDTLAPARRKIVMQDYLAGPYMLDPFVQQVMAGTRSGCFRLLDLAPDRFRQSEYFRVHYRLTGIREEVGFFFPMPGAAVGVLSLARLDDAPRLTRRELGILRLIEPALGAFCAEHYATQPEADDHRAPLTDAYQSFGDKLLSEREREIVALVLQGHSTESIAGRLDISPGTVKIHRRNIYRKLGIGTQAELFARFLRFIS